MRRALLFALLVFLAYGLFAQEGFPLYGIKAGDSPETVESLFIKAGYTKNRETVGKTSSKDFWHPEYYVLYAYSEEPDYFFITYSFRAKVDFFECVSSMRKNLGNLYSLSDRERKAEWRISSATGSIVIKLSQDTDDGNTSLWIDFYKNR
ncbi:MAG: hypothetical protein FWG29_01835 [Treponema sp.]|nr:hypothetical protein [Treponema sp.]